MNNIEQIYELMPELIEETKVEDKTITFSDRAKAIIKEIATYARSTKIYKNSREQGEEFWRDNEKTPYMVYAFMLDRIVNAPTSIHRNCSVLLHIPTLDELVNGKETEQ